MARLLPFDSDISPPDAEPRVLGLDSEDADDVIAALSSETARSVLTALHERPDTPSELADRVGTSLQNVQYHLGKLSEAELIEVIDTVYSEKGREMNVYAPADRPLVLFSASESERTGIKAALMRLLGGVGVLGLVSLLVQRWAEGSIAPSFTDGSGGAGGGDAADGAGAQEAADATEMAAETATALGIDPGVLFFLGGLVALLAVAAIWYYQTRR